MCWLSIEFGEEGDRQSVRVPCPAIDLIRLATVSSDGNSLESLTRRNPALLVAGLAGYHEEFGCPPASAAELRGWLRLGLIAVLERSPIEMSVTKEAIGCSQKSLSNFFVDFLQARSNKQLRRSLQAFLWSFCGQEKKLSKQLAAKWVGKQLRADQFKSKHIRRQLTCDNVIQRWLGDAFDEIDVAALIRLSARQNETDIEFKQRLHEEKLASVKQLAYGASHEINNPLANIATRAQTMLTGEQDPEKRHKLSVIYEQAMRAHEMISDMMLFAHPPAIKRNHVSLRLLMSRLVNELKPVTEAAPWIEFSVYVGAGVDKVYVDPTQISVAIKNLIKNSFEALSASNKRKNRIEVRVDAFKRGIQVSVWDNGPTIKSEVAHHMFDPFYSGREAGRGLGFGLSKVWTIAKQHGGELRYDLGSSDGTLFVLTIPAKRFGTTASNSGALTINEASAHDDEDAA